MKLYFSKLCLLVLFLLPAISIANEERKFGAGIGGGFFLHYLPTASTMLSARLINGGSASESDGESFFNTYANVLLEYRQYAQLEDVKKFYLFRVDDWFFYNRSKNIDQQSTNIENSFVGFVAGYGLEKELVGGFTIDGLIGIGFNVHTNDFGFELNGPNSRVMLNYFW